MSNAAYHRLWRAEHKTECAEAQRRYIEKNGAKTVSLAKNHAISMDEARAAIAAKPTQCEICRRSGVKLYYDHDHATQEHRGWLCNRCNVALPLLEDSELRGAALRYLERCDAAV